MTAFKVVPPPYALSALQAFPSSIQGCHTALALSEREFNRGEYIFADDIGTQAVVVAGDVETSLRFVKDVEHATRSIKEYSNGTLKIRVELEPVGPGERGAQMFRGELIVTHGKNSATEKVYGERAC